MPVCLIGLGSNQGNRQQTLDAAVARLGTHSAVRSSLAVRGTKRRRSAGRRGRRTFSTAPSCWKRRSGRTNCSRFCNRSKSNWAGSVTARWGPRTIDLDLLLYDDVVLSMPSLVLPHPRLAMAAVRARAGGRSGRRDAPPDVRWTIARLLAHLNTSTPYVAITGPIAAGKTRLAQRLAAAISGRLMVEQPDWDRLEAFYANPAEQGGKPSWNSSTSGHGCFRTGSSPPEPWTGERFLV